MASPRIPISWLLLLAVLAVFTFFGYHIFKASSDTDVEKFPPYSEEDSHSHAHVRFMDPPAMIMKDDMNNDGHAPVVQHIAVQQMPRVAGQTEADLREPEPLQRTPPTTEYGPPEHTDPLNKTVHMPAEFGSNFRHPEQMIETHPPIRDEIAQNSGEVMTGILAYDSTAEGNGYSML